MTIQEQLQQAFEYYRTGNLQQAKNICRDILQKHSGNADVYHFLGIICYERGEFVPATEYFTEALRCNPHDPHVHFHLGNLMKDTGQLDEAVTKYQKAIQLSPDFVGAYANLGNALLEQGRMDEALDNLQKAVQLDPDDGTAYFNLGNALLKQGHPDEAVSSFQKSILLNPDDADGYNNLGVALKEKGQMAEAMTYYQKAIRLNPGNSEAHFNLGYAFMKQGNLQNAVNEFKTSLSIKPDSTRTLTYLANTLGEQGKADEAESWYQKAMQIVPVDHIPYEAFLMSMHYSDRNTPEDIYSEHVKFAGIFEGPLSDARFIHTKRKIPDRRLKIGYVSPDFRRHSVAYFIEPVLAEHNHQEFDIICYSNAISDAVTENLQGYADTWRDIVGLNDIEVEKIIREDEIDILIDLAGHTAGNRILLFARKPAPVQVTWIGYPATTGLTSMDYKIVDHMTDAVDDTRKFYSETLVRLPGSFLCYRPDNDSPEVGELPALQKGYITFGSCNNFAKVTSVTIHLWIDILHSIPNARIILKTKSFSDHQTRMNTLALFTREGISAERVQLFPWVPSTRGHLAIYHSIDLALDTYPYNGATTTCEALWMGVPVVTLSGRTHASRVGRSLLSAVGLPDLVTDTPDAYREKCVSLAANTDRLQHMRTSLRQQMASSPLTDAKRFTLNMENCYRSLWERWCSSQ